MGRNRHPKKTNKRSSAARTTQNVPIMLFLELYRKIVDIPPNEKLKIFNQIRPSILDPEDYPLYITYPAFRCYFITFLVYILLYTIYTIYYILYTMVYIKQFVCWSIHFLISRVFSIADRVLWVIWTLDNWQSTFMRVYWPSSLIPRTVHSRIWIPHLSLIEMLISLVWKNF